MMLKLSLKFMMICLLGAFFSVVPCRAQNNEDRPLFVIWDERGKYGFIDSTGSISIKPQFDGALPFSEKLAAVSLKGKWGFIDSSGKVVVPLIYHAASSFSDGLAAVNIESNMPPYSCGYIDHTGRFVISPQNKLGCAKFNEGLAVVGVYNEQVGEDMDGYMDKAGRLTIGGQYALAEPFSGGLALVNDFTESFFINKEGATAINLKGYGGTETLSDVYVPAGSFSEGLAEVGIKSFSRQGYASYGFVNKRGTVVFKLPPEMSVKGAFHNGRALIRQEQTQKVKVKLGDGETIIMEVQVSPYGYIDDAGKEIIPARFAEAEDFSEGIAVVMTGKPRTANKRDLVGSAAESYVSSNDGSWICINRAGEVVIKRCGEPLSREEIDDKFPVFGKTFGTGFENGLFFNKIHVGDAQAGANQKVIYGYMDKNGKCVWIQPHGKDVIPPKWWRENFTSPKHVPTENNQQMSTSCEDVAKNSFKIKAGMSESEVLELLGAPTTKLENEWVYDFFGCVAPPQVGEQKTIGLDIIFNQRVVKEIKYASICATGPAPTPKSKPKKTNH